MHVTVITVAVSRVSTEYKSATKSHPVSKYARGEGAALQGRNYSNTSVWMYIPTDA